MQQIRKSISQSVNQIRKSINKIQGIRKSINKIQQIRKLSVVKKFKLKK